MTPVIRRISEQDSPYLQDILVKRWEVSPAEALEYAIRYTSNYPQATGFIAVIDGKQVGICLFDHNNKDVDNTRHPWISGLWVEPSQRGKELGQALMQACITEAKYQVFSSIYLDTTDAEKYHEKFGWETIGTANYHGEETTIMQLIP